jgi:AraC-like DNA-binding protein
MSRLSAQDLAFRMPADWGMTTDAPKIVGLCGGVSSCLLVGLPGEVSAPASDNHILSFVTRGEPHHRLWHDAKIVTDGPLPSHSINIVPAGRAPRAVIAQPIRVLHVYLPHDHLMLLASTIQEGHARQGLEIVDPHYEPDPELEGLLGALEGGIRDCTSAGALWREGLCQAILARVIQRWSNFAQGERRSETVRAPGLAPWQLRRTLDRLTSNLAAEPTLGTLAAEVGLSPFHFARAFKVTTGLPPHRKLVELRLTKARELLEATDLSITEISAAVGYDDPGYLARLFRKHIGMTPAAYRRERQS